MPLTTKSTTSNQQTIPPTTEPSRTKHGSNTATLMDALEKTPTQAKIAGSPVLHITKTQPSVTKWVALARDAQLCDF